MPAFAFLLEQPTAVRVQLLAIPRRGPVHRTGDTNSHDWLRCAFPHLHEARDRHAQTLYSMYLRWQRDERRVVIIDGAAKPSATTLLDVFCPPAVLASAKKLAPAPCPLPQNSDATQPPAPHGASFRIGSGNPAGFSPICGYPNSPHPPAQSPKTTGFAGISARLARQQSRLPCRRSRVRVPSAASRKPRKSRGFLISGVP